MYEEEGGRRLVILNYSMYSWINESSNNATTFESVKLSTRWEWQVKVYIFHTCACSSRLFPCLHAAASSRSCIEMPPRPKATESRLKSHGDHKTVPRSGTDWELEREGGGGSETLIGSFVKRDKEERGIHHARCTQ